jgi:hypothetical protein
MSSEEDISLMLADCEQRESKLSDWERQFIDDIGTKVSKNQGLTQGQDAKLTEIWERITA